MASMASFLRAYQGGTDSAKVGRKLGELLTDADAMMALLGSSGQPSPVEAQISPIQPGELLREQAVADAQAREQGAQRTLQNIPSSPLGASIAMLSTPAYNRLTEEVPGANPEAPNVVAAADNLALGGLIDAPVARGLMRTRPPSAREMAPARLRGMPRGGEEAAPPFYSQARTVVEDPKTQGTQTGEAWSRFLTDPKRGVKAEEMQWTGLGDFLKSKAGERVTRDEILGHLDSNEIEVKEVTKGARGVNPEDIQKADEEMRRTGIVYRQNRTPENEAAFNAAVERYENLQLDYSGDKRETKFEKYTLPGAKNYREVLLTLPKKQSQPSEKVAGTIEVIPEGERGAGMYRVRIGDRTGTVMTRQGAEEELARLQHRTQQIDDVRADERVNFTSGHWDEPNVLAHLRLSDREDADGKRTLLVEEIQSDWAQKGRREGFRPDDADWLDKRRQEIEALGERATLEQKREWAAIKNEQKKAIPTAPFVTDTSKWTTLGLKRVLKMAADEGYDRIGIVPGAEQAKRYDLSKQIDRIDWIPGDRTIRAYKDGSQVIGRTLKSDAELADVIGKEAADKILKQPMNEAEGFRRAPYQSLSGVDLQVGGEGMRGYYDKIVPEALNKLAKEHGVKVQLEGGKVLADQQPDYTLQQSGDSYIVLRKGKTFKGFSDKAAAEEFLKKANQPLGTPIHTLDVPPEMKAKIKKKGFPLYSRTLGDLLQTGQNA
jgi:hypothetical protein